MGAPAGNHNSSSWDIYLWDLFSGLPINLTANNGLRDEDPKFSPNGSEIVFKQDGDLKVMDLINDTIIHTTNNGYSIEESMPYYTSDSQYIIYARGAGISSDIYLINKDGMENQPLENITNIQEYYPIIRSNSTFLYTRWVSAANHHDQIYLGYFSDTNAQSLSFNDESADDSDPFPVNSEYVLFSSNRSGGQGGWDLYLADINSSTTWSMDEFNLNSSIHELGICYFSGASINGCTDPEACNYDETANVDDGSCEYPEENYDCDGNCIAEFDCAGECAGSAVDDECGVCGGDGIPAGDCDCDGNVDAGCGCGEAGPSGCDMTCGSTLENDECGVCDGDNCSCADCNGMPNGGLVVDECGVCGGDGIADGACDCDGNVDDCAGECGGTSALDDCGVCDGGNADDLGCGCFEDGPSGCDETCGSTLEFDDCGVCNGDGIADGACDCDGNVDDCAGECGGDSEEDECGTCDSDSSNDCDRIVWVNGMVQLRKRYFI